MNSLKFRPYLIKDILSGDKTVTWRLFDDKDLQIGEHIELLNWETREKFAEAEITKIIEKKIADISEADYIGHEKYKNQEELLSNLCEYYGDKISLDTLVKIITFRIL